MITGWAVHRRPDSTIPTEPEAARRHLRRGNLPDELLKGALSPALRIGDARLSHEELRERVDQVAAGFARTDIEMGRRVAIYAERSFEWVLAYLALQRLGAVVIPMNPAYQSAEVAHILTDAEPDAIVVDAARRDVVAPSLTLPRRRGRESGPIARNRGREMPVIGIEALPTGGPAPKFPRLDPERPALILYTSGTTGRPKGALLDHGNLLAQARGVIEAWRWEPHDTLVLALPLFHLHGLAIGLHASLLIGAQAVVIPFTPEGVIAELRAGASMFFGVPAMYHRLAEVLERNPCDLTRVRLFVSGSAPLPPALFERCERALGQPVLERYGITEGGIVVSNPYDGPRLPGRVGFPLPGVEVRLGGQDEVQLKAGQVFSGYWRNPSATREAFEDGWLRTGDIGELAPDGSLAIRGRLTDLIISGGYNVYPREVELVLEAQPAVREVAVVGVPSERWGEEVAAFVVANGQVTAADLIAYTRDHLAAYKCPREVHFVTALPRNAMGKVQRSMLMTAAG